jgi:hypothetical protein
MPFKIIKLCRRHDGPAKIGMWICLCINMMAINLFVLIYFLTIHPSLESSKFENHVLRHRTSMANYINITSSQDESAWHNSYLLYRYQLLPQLHFLKPYAYTKGPGWLHLKERKSQTGSCIRFFFTVAVV